MTPTEIISRVKLRFGDSRGTILTTPFFIDAINEGQLAIAREIQWGEAKRTDLTAADFREDVAGATVSAKLLTREVFYGTRPLAVIDKETISRMGYWNLPEGTPEAYYEVGNDYFMFPVPIETDTTACKITYVPHPTVIDDVADSISLPIRYHDDLSDYVLMLAHERNENWRAAQVIRDRFLTNLSNRKHEAMSTDDTYRVIGPDIMDQDFIIGYYQ